MTDQPIARVALKPCPFCGDDTIHTRVIETTDPDDPYVYHECDRCQVETMARDREEAITAWNTRTPAGQDLAGEVEAAYAALFQYSGADQRVHAARKALLEVLGGQGSEGQRAALKERQA